MTEIVLIIPSLERDRNQLISFLESRAIMNGVRYIIKLNYFDDNLPHLMDVDYINMPDNGIYQAWRQALFSISCDTNCLIGFLGVSDRINEVFLEQVLSHKSANFNVFYGHRNGQKLKNPHNVQLFDEKRVWFDVQHPGLLVHRKLFEDFLHGSFITVAAQDLEFFIRLNKGSDIRTLYIDTVQAFMAKNGASYSKTFLRQYLKDWFQIYVTYKVIAKVPFMTFLKILVKSL